MLTICVPIPSLSPSHTVDVAVTVDGRQRLMQYRVETFDWMQGGPPDDRHARLRRFIQTYDEGWQLVQIGAPSGDLVPVTFRQQTAVSSSPRA